MTHKIPYSHREYHAKEHKWNVTPQTLMVQINEIILPGLGFASSPTIHLNTARNYLKELGDSTEHDFPLDYHITELREQPKGLKQVLMERELWPNKGLKLEEARK
ncbi:3457_t:CDS:2, partial [Funneliformis caledonium]